MKRFKHSLSHYKLLTCDMGRLVPIGLLEALPGDTFQHSTSLLVRMSPLLAPVMHPVSVRVHHWFVPFRLIWDQWENFITGGKDGLGDGAVFPVSGALTAAKNDLWDYFGVKPGIALPAGALSMLPIRAYNKIYNEFYRDEDLITEVAEGQTNTLLASWEKDYFTTARPWTQKGPAVTIPIGDSAVVKTQATANVFGAQEAMQMKRIDGAGPGDAGLATSGGKLWRDIAAGINAPANESLYPANLYADLANATAPDIIDFRRAFALQRFQEARAQYGSRYTEYLRYVGVRPSDARLQRPEYLGGGKQTIAFSEVLRTGNIAADEAANPIGQMRGHGISALRSNRYRYFCEEHGYIMTLLSIRPRAIYADGLNRTFSRRTKEDFYQRELELIGQQEVFKRELNLEGDATDAEVFGYQDRYAEYRHQYSGVAGDFRDVLDFWHMARLFAATPTLNQSFIECVPTKRIFAVETEDVSWIMASHSVQARRMVGNKTIGKIL